MPTTFTHDLFGREVYRMLPQEEREKIRRHGRLYRIGLHGPDILFYFHLYKNRVNQHGVNMHQEIARPFLERGLRRAHDEGDEALFVYLLGFVCHFLLDSTCHPYIYSIESEVSHTLIEKELDRLLMEKDGKDPFVYRPSCCIQPDRKTARTIQKVFPEFSPLTIYRSLCMMKRTTNLMIYRNSWRQRLLVAALKACGQGKLSEHIMRKEKDPFLDPYLNRLRTLYETAKSDAPDLLKSVSVCAKTLEPLPARFDRNYKYL